MGWYGRLQAGGPGSPTVSAEAQSSQRSLQMAGASSQLEADAYRVWANRRQQEKMQPLGKGKLG